MRHPLLPAVLFIVCSSLVQAGDVQVNVTIEGAGSGSGDTDKFRIKIRDEANESVVHDNEPGAADDADPTTVIRSGSIVIHTKGKK